MHIFRGIINEPFFRYQGGEMLYAQCVGFAKDVAYPLNPPLLKKQSHIQEKQRAMNQRPWMKQCLWVERKVSLFHTLSTGLHQFPPPFQQKRKNENVKNRGDQHQEQEKVNKVN